MYSMRLFKSVSLCHFIYRRTGAPAALLGLMLLATPARAATISTFDEFVTGLGLPVQYRTVPDFLSEDLSRAWVFDRDEIELIGGDTQFLWWQSGQPPVATGVTVNQTGKRFSSDGRTMVFRIANSDTTSLDDQVGRWRPDMGLEIFDLLTADNERLLQPWEVSGDGNRVIGEGTNADETSGVGTIIWDDGELPTTINVFLDREVLSDDGSAIVGFNPSPSTPSQFGEVLRWTESTGLESIATLGDGAHSIVDISADGSSVLLREDNGTGRGSIWREGQGLTQLPLQPRRLAPDMNLIYMLGTPGMVWDETNGLRPLSEFLTDEHGLGDALQGWALRDVDFVLSDGQVLIGRGDDPTGETNVDIVIDLRAPIPEPATTALLLTSLFTLSAVRRGVFATTINR